MSSGPGEDGAAPRADAYDYIVVGSGAGGGPVAANLAEAGFTVLLVEAGGRAEPPTYSVPGFHAFAAEDASMKWDYFVRHYADGARARRDPKFCGAQDGVLYPRAGTLGGCTAHHAMITIYPHGSDWNAIAKETGDKSWSAGAMRRYFMRLERKTYRGWSRAILRWTGWNIGRHGYDGWLPITMASPLLLLGSPTLLRLVLTGALTAQGILQPWVPGLLKRALNILFSARDINSWTLRRRGQTGVRLVPVSIDASRRRGTRERIDAVRAAHPDRLHVALNALVTNILFDDGAGPPPAIEPRAIEPRAIGPHAIGPHAIRPRAIGVRYLRGANLYAAAPQPAGPRPEPEAAVEVFCRREVILCAGAFNTPQLLMLSGIGPKAELDKHGIPVRLDRPGVGQNLQDRYEVGVVSRMKRRFDLLEGALYRAPESGEQPDPQYGQWLEGDGPYSTNGAILSVIRRSDRSQREPDLFCFGLVGGFRGYFPGYAKEAVEPPCFTWCVLKAHTENRGGSVTLASADPRDRPNIDFRYFDEGTGDAARDLQAVVTGVQFCRALNAQNKELIAEELVPGSDVGSDAEVAQFVKDEAWGHHASCSCRIGKSDDPMAVVDSRFRVIGTDGLRIVDASVFPRIPGFFIVTPIYMIAEKASDAIIRDARPAKNTR